MDGFNPDQYLAEKLGQGQPPFNPDKYLAEKTGRGFLPMAMNAGRAAFGVATNPIQPLLTPEARGVGQGAIQGATMGYGMPALRAAIPNSQQVPLPSMKEDLVGGALSLPVGGAGMAGLASKAGKLAPFIPMAAGYAYNPSNTEIEPAISGKRALDAGLAGVTQLGAAGVSKLAGYINPDAVNALVRGIKPGKGNTNFNSDAAIALPIIKQTGHEVNTVGDFVEASKKAKTAVWDKVKSLFKQAGADEVVSPSYEDIKKTAMQMRNDEFENYNNASNFTEQVKNISGGGIKPYKKGVEMDEYVNDIPNRFKNSKGMALDEVVQNYNDTFGTEFDENSFVRELKKYDGIKKPSSNYKEYMNDASKSHQEYFHGSLLDGSDISSNMVKSVPPESVKLSPEMGNAISDVADSYKGKTISIPEAEDRLQKINAGLTSYFKANARGQYVRGQEAGIAADLAERIQLKNALNEKIQSLTGEQLAPLKKQYGALMNIQDEALGRINVSNRQNPVSLQEALNGVAGITELFGGNPLGLVQIGASQAVKKLNSAGYLVSRAVANTGKKPNMFLPTATKMAGATIPGQMQSANYQVGQIIKTPKGNVRVVGLDTDGHPLIQPLQ